MAQTKQIPRNPHVSRQKTAVGSDVQPKRSTTPKPTSIKAPVNEESNLGNICHGNYYE